MTTFATSKQPILVILSWRGGARFKRALESLRDSEGFFKRIIISVTSELDSEDLKLAWAYRDSCKDCEPESKVEIICSERELPTMEHQAFWIDYLLSTGATPKDWIYWLAYDDELYAEGIKRIIDRNGNWPLQTGACYFGPWIIRHEQVDSLWDRERADPDEIWTCMTSRRPTTVARWIGEQIEQPTYIQMSGSLAPLSSHFSLVNGKHKKRFPMRIEMATAVEQPNYFVTELNQPVSIIYGRPNSDRSNYADVARGEDLDLLRRIGRRMIADKRFRVGIMQLIRSLALVRVRGPKAELWRVRPQVIAPSTPLD